MESLNFLRNKKDLPDDLIELALDYWFDYILLWTPRDGLDLPRLYCIDTKSSAVLRIRVFIRGIYGRNPTRANSAVTTSVLWTSAQGSESTVGIFRQHVHRVVNHRT
eukprot:1195437-Prorocentrum_minimum.AAC.6